MSEEESGIAEVLLSGEQALLDPEVRRDRDRVEALLAPDFEEFGASGRQWKRAEIVDLLATEAYEPPAIQDFRCRMIAPEVALTTYRAVRKDAATGAITASNRSSLWRLEDRRWRLCFHQGTPAA
jgi:hypothetical protein